MELKNEFKSIDHNPFDRVIKNGPEFQPYDNNGGTIVAIAGENFAIIASDTRLVSGYSVANRNMSKLYRITDKIVLGSSGCLCDSLTFSRILEFRNKMYRYDNNQDMSCDAVSQLVAIMLYNRRFFPYYIHNLLAGIDADGKGYVYAYDPVGCKESIRFDAAGNGAAYLIPILITQISKTNIENCTPEDQKLSLEDSLIIVKDAFRVVSEREVTCGDGIHIQIITKDGIKEEIVPLRKD